MPQGTDIIIPKEEQPVGVLEPRKEELVVKSAPSRVDIANQDTNAKELDFNADIEPI